MDNEIVGGYSGDVRERCVPSQRIEVEARMVIDHATEPTPRRVGWPYERRRSFRTAVRGQVFRFSGSGFDMVKLSAPVVARPPALRFRQEVLRGERFRLSDGRGHVSLTFVTLSPDAIAVPEELAGKFI